MVCILRMWLERIGVMDLPIFVLENPIAMPVSHLRQLAIVVIFSLQILRLCQVRRDLVIHGISATPIVEQIIRQLCNIQRISLVPVALIMFVRQFQEQAALLQFAIR